MSNMKDLTGMKVGRLTVLNYEKSDKRGKARWRCKCDYGRETVVGSQKLIMGTTKSCGCLKKDMSPEIRKTHGESGSRLYLCWSGMKARCYNLNEQSYKNYGGRGIKVCDEWNDSYIAFREWALNNGYSESLTLDRIDVNDDYRPDNCRWATRVEQNNNRRNNHIIKYNGENHTLAEWARILNMSYDGLQMRINKLKWPIARAFTTPFRSCKRSVEQ